jgi:hypothetical protein
MSSYNWDNPGLWDCLYEDRGSEATYCIHEDTTLEETTCFVLLHTVPKTSIGRMMPS